MTCEMSTNICRICVDANVNYGTFAFGWIWEHCINAIPFGCNGSMLFVLQSAIFCHSYIGKMWNKYQTATNNKSLMWALNGWHTCCTGYDLRLMQNIQLNHQFFGDECVWTLCTQHHTHTHAHKPVTCVYSWLFSFGRYFDVGIDAIHIFILAL